jgi:ribosomal subunit interface protein
MKLPLQITTRNVSLSETAMSTIREKAAKLESFYDRIMSCRVLVEAPHRHKHQGIRYNVRIDLTIPAHEIVVKREPNEDLYVAIRDAFDAARRQLQDIAHQQRGEIKTHEPTHPIGFVRRLYPEGDYGFIETPDGREIYFHRNSVKGNGGFDHLTPDLEVRFVEEEGEKGPQATVVLPLGK